MLTDVPPDDSLLAPLRYKSFRVLWAGFVVSHIGDFIQLLAQSWLVVELTRSAFKVGVVAFAQAIPRLLIGLFAGVLVDRVDRRRLLLVTQSLAALQSVVFLALVVTHRITYGALVALALALGVFDALNLTARQALMPTLVPRALLPRAVALQALGVNVTQLVGPSLGGVLLGWLHTEGCLVVNALSFAALIVSLVKVELPAPPPAKAAQGFGDDLREGLGYVRAHGELLYPILLAYALGLLGMPLVRLLPLFAKEVLGATGRGYGFLASASGVGALAASLAVTARARPRELPRNIVVAGLVFGCALVGFAWTRHYAVAWAVLALFGASQMAFRSAVTTLLQTESPERMRGRIMGALSLDFALWSIGAVGVGLTADAIARHAAGVSATAALPGWAITRGLHVSFVAHGALCLVAVLFAARPLLACASKLGAATTPPKA